MNKEISGDKPVIEIFWTVWYDSTFRIVQLSRCEVYIQPYYISDERISEPNELKAILLIKSMVLLLKLQLRLLGNT